MIVTVYRYGNVEDKGYWFSFHVTEWNTFSYHEANSKIGGKYLYEYQITIKNPYYFVQNADTQKIGMDAERLYWTLFDYGRKSNYAILPSHQKRIAEKLIPMGYDSVIFQYKFSDYSNASPREKIFFEGIYNDYYDRKLSEGAGIDNEVLWLLKNIDNYRYYARKIK